MQKVSTVLCTIVSLICVVILFNLLGAENITNKNKNLGVGKEINESNATTIARKVIKEYYDIDVDANKMKCEVRYEEPEGYSEYGIYGVSYEGNIKGSLKTLYVLLNEENGQILRADNYTYNSEKKSSADLISEENAEELSSKFIKKIDEEIFNNLEAPRVKKYDDVGYTLVYLRKDYNGNNGVVTDVDPFTGDVVSIKFVWDLGNSKEDNKHKENMNFIGEEDAIAISSGAINKYFKEDVKAKGFTSEATINKKDEKRPYDIWVVNWNEPKENKKYVYTTMIRVDNGVIEKINKNDYKSNSTESISEEKAKSIAQNFFEECEPQKFKEATLKKISKDERNGYIVEYMGTKENKNTVTIMIDPFSGKVISVTILWK